MTTNSTRIAWVLGLAAAMTMAAATAQDDPCTLPGMAVIEDASNDSVDTQGYSDLQSLHLAEPASMPNKLVFTYKMRDLATLPPSFGWIVRFQTDSAPTNGDEDYFVAMLNSPRGTYFVHGTDGFSIGAPAGEPRQFRIAGDLDAASNYAEDGTITLVLDKSAVPAILPGLAVFNILATTRVMTPPEDPAPFSTNADNTTILDDALGAGYYDVVGNESCGEEKAILGMTVGGVPAATLALLALAAFVTRRRRRD